MRKKFLILITLIIVAYSAAAYFETVMFYTIHPTEVIETSKTNISHKELRKLGIVPDPDLCYQILKSNRYLYEGEIFYIKKTLIDTTTTKYDSYHIVAK